MFSHYPLLFYDVPFPMVRIHLRLNEVHWILFLDDARGNLIAYERGGMSANHRAPTCAPNDLASGTGQASPEPPRARLAGSTRTFALGLLNTTSCPIFTLLSALSLSQIATLSQRIIDRNSRTFVMYGRGKFAAAVTPSKARSTEKNHQDSVVRIRVIRV